MRHLIPPFPGKLTRVREAAGQRAEARLRGEPFAPKVQRA